MKAAPHSNGNPFNSFAQPPRLRRPSRFGLPVLLGLLLLGLVGQAKAQSDYLEHNDVLNLTFYVGVTADYTLPNMGFCKALLTPSPALTLILHSLAFRANLKGSSLRMPRASLAACPPDSGQHR